MKIKLDPARLTLGDMEDFEDTAGVGLMDTFAKIDQTGALTGVPIKVITALVWICARKDDPMFTLADARAIELEALDIDVGGNGAGPTPGGG